VTDSLVPSPRRFRKKPMVPVSAEVSHSRATPPWPSRAAKLRRMAAVGAATVSVSDAVLLLVSTSVFVLAVTVAVFVTLPPAAAGALAVAGELMPPPTGIDGIATVPFSRFATFSCPAPPPAVGQMAPPEAVQEPTAVFVSPATAGSERVDASVLGPLFVTVRVYIVIPPAVTE